jgi:hypothetical protein
MYNRKKNKMNAKLNFATKQEYLNYRDNWKMQYSALSQKIREYKFCKWFSSLGRPDRITPELTAKFESLRLKHINRYYYIKPLKDEATAMLVELKEAKLLAQIRYLQCKNEELCVA